MGFAEEIVTGYSRPLSSDEHWTLYYFEEHALQCSQCFEPLRVHKTGGQLCDEGHDLAIAVARLMFYSHSRGGIFSRAKEDSQETRVETPPSYRQTLGLLQAIQRALRNGDRFVKSKSLDRTYYVPPRQPVMQHHHHDVGFSSSSDEGRSSHRSRDSEYAVKVIEPKAPKPRSRRESMVSDSRRGSLYGEDMADLVREKKREQRLKYNLEVREPSGKSSRRYG